MGRDKVRGEKYIKASNIHIFQTRACQVSAKLPPVEAIPLGFGMGVR
jgi:hypothetical protein